MEKNRKSAIKQKTLIPVVVALIGALLMVLCVFLPYSAASEERAEWIDKYPDTVVFEEMNLTAADMKHISMAKYAHIYFIMSEELWHDSTAGILYVVLAALIGGGAVVAALFALGRKPIGCMIFGGLACGVFHLVNLDFIDRGVIPSDSYDWGIAHTLFPIAAVIMIAGALWMLAVKIVIKRQQRKEQLAQAAGVSQ